jgi:hypothetical protein
LPIEGFECQAFFCEAERFETLAHPATMVNHGLAVRQQLMSFALSALALLWVCEKTLPPQRYLSFIPLKLFEVNHLGSTSDRFSPRSSSRLYQRGWSHDTRPPDCAWHSARTISIR